EQCLYNLTARQVEAEVIPSALAHGAGILVWAPLHGGLLSGAVEKLAAGTAEKSAQGRAAEAMAEWRDAVTAYERTCAALERSPAEVGMAWVLSRPGVTSVVIGPRTPSHIDGAIAALERPLTNDELARVEAPFAAARVPMTS
ncbi:MAG: aldo/keto reductase, partial [Pseudomonadota bacterium]